jgi:hypothetical protein
MRISCALSNTKVPFKIKESLGLNKKNVPVSSRVFGFSPCKFFCCETTLVFS